MSFKQWRGKLSDLIAKANDRKGEGSNTQRHRSRKRPAIRTRRVSPIRYTHQNQILELFCTRMLYLALSCLQGRPALQACLDLKSLGVAGIQLTPGNVPDPALADALAQVPFRTHHGFSWSAMKQRVWDDSGTCRVSSDSVHPPTEREPAFDVWWDAIGDESRPAIYETMYPGYRLGCGAEIERAMDLRLNLAVDVSHIHIQRCAGVLSPETWRRLQQYAGIAELHVSDNQGRIDSHRPISLNTFGLGWARERASTGLPLVLEAYMHKLSDAERHAQVELLSS